MTQMKRLTLEEYRKRTESIRLSEENAVKFRFRHRIKDYVPGWVFYNIGGYPAKNNYAGGATEYDYNTLKELHDNGAGFIRLHSEWCDMIRALGGDKFTPYDPEGVRSMIKAIHDNHLKVTAYFASNMFDMRDPDFSDKFMRPGTPPPVMTEIFYRLAKPYSGSPEWLDYMLPRVEKLLTDYEVDGLMNDSGCADLWTLSDPVAMAYAEDMLYKLYNMVHSYGKIMRFHYSGALGSPLDEKIYDYLSIGEATQSYEGIGAYRGFAIARDHAPYVVPKIDARLISEEDADEQFAYFIPFIQFPELKYGRPRTDIFDDEDMKGWAEEHCTEHARRLSEYNKTHPNGPYSYTEWSAIPDNPRMKETWFKYLNLYKPMVEEGSVVHVDVTESPFIRSTLTNRVIASFFTNEEFYIVVSNLEERPYELVLSEPFTNRETGETKNTYTIPPKRMVFLKK